MPSQVAKYEIVWRTLGSIDNTIDNWLTIPLRHEQLESTEEQEASIGLFSAMRQDYLRSSYKIKERAVFFNLLNGATRYTLASKNIFATPFLMSFFFIC